MQWMVKEDFLHRDWCSTLKNDYIIDESMPDIRLLFHCPQHSKTYLVLDCSLIIEPSTQQPKVMILDHL